MTIKKSISLFVYFLIEFKKPFCSLLFEFKEIYLFISLWIQKIVLFTYSFIVEYRLTSEFIWTRSNELATSEIFKTIETILLFFPCKINLFKNTKNTQQNIKLYIEITDNRKILLCNGALLKYYILQHPLEVLPSTFIVGAKNFIFYDNKSDALQKNNQIINCFQ